jgi:succinyl-CoA synthetase alpha subunit
LLRYDNANEYVKKETVPEPNCPELYNPGEAKVGIMLWPKGTVGIVSKSGTSTTAADQVVKQGLGITTAIGIGGDPLLEQTKRSC